MGKKQEGPRLRVVPCTIREANAFIDRLHRHHDGLVTGVRVAVAVADESGLVRGVAVLGNPRARLLCDGQTIEVSRVCTDGCPNACSALYGASRRIAKELGFSLVITYILDNEPGTSLRASGWTFDGQAGGGDWFREREGRTSLRTERPEQGKGRWSVRVSAPGEYRWPENPTEPTLPLFEAV